MKRYIQYFSLVALTILSIESCVSESELDYVSESSDKISISTYIGNTRSDNKTMFEQGDKISIYASTSEGGFSGTFSPDLMNNVQATLGENGWSYSPIVGWPADDNKKVSFAAFYPTMTSTTDGYYFDLARDRENQVDAL